MLKHKNSSKLLMLKILLRNWYQSSKIFLLFFTLFCTSFFSERFLFILVVLFGNFLKISGSHIYWIYSQECFKTLPKNGFSFQILKLKVDFQKNDSVSKLKSWQIKIFFAQFDKKLKNSSYTFLDKLFFYSSSNMWKSQNIKPFSPDPGTAPSTMATPEQNF